MIKMAKETHEFQAETKQLLDLMIHSIYTNREIFLRELISNASDAIDKLHFESLTNRDILEGSDAYEIFLVPDKESKTLTISDNGIGMSRAEVVENIGTIAKSGTKAFMEQLAKAKEENGGTPDKDLIGQFGVGRRNGKGGRIQDRFQLFGYGIWRSGKSPLHGRHETRRHHQSLWYIQGYGGTDFDRHPKSRPSLERNFIALFQPYRCTSKRLNRRAP